MTFLAIFASVVTLIVSIAVIVYSENGTGRATVCAAWIIAAVLWLAWAVG